MYVRALYSAFKKARKEHSFNEKKALSIKQNQVRFDQNCGGVKVDYHLRTEAPPQLEPPMTMDRFISEGYLIKALDLPEEFADQLL